MSNYKRSTNKVASSSNTWFLVNAAFLTLYTVLAGFFIFKMYAHQFLAFRYVNGFCCKV